MAHEMRKAGVRFEQQKPISVVYDGLVFDRTFRADLIVEDELIVEIKSVSNLTAVFEAQLLTYLRLSDKRVGLLINFNARLLKGGIKRLVL